MKESNKKESWQDDFNELTPIFASAVMIALLYVLFRLAVERWFT